MTQPAAGIAASALVIAVSLGFISLFEASLFLGWVTYALLCIIPMEIVIGITWAAKIPAFAGARTQPAKGLLLALVTFAAGAVVGPVYFATAGGGIAQPSPMLMMCAIVSVIITFWAAIMWGGWPFTAWIRNPLIAGLTMLASCYAVNYVLFRWFFNYEFMRGAPVYVASLDPHGLFHANRAMVFYMCALTIMFVMLHFDLWPLTKFPAVMKQPSLGLAWTGICLALGGALYWLGIDVLAVDPLQFMVWVPVAFIFGTIIVLNMLENSLFARHAQPLRGGLNTIAAAVIGTLLALGYAIAAPVISGKLAPGPPGNDFERWVASALLAVTFPLLVFHAEFFKFWPLKKN